MAAEPETDTPSSEVSGAAAEVAPPPLWRRVPGIVVMTLGMLAIAFFLALGVTVSLTYVDWRDPFDGLGTVFIVCAPPLLVGAALVALGRLIFGGWQTQSPLALAGAITLPVAGVVAAFGAIAIFFLALFEETGRGGAWAVSQFLLCVMFGLALVVAGMVLRRRLAA